MKPAAHEPTCFGPDGLADRDRQIILDAFARYPEIERVTLFGSRAMGTYGQGSDIDLALEGRGIDRSSLARLAADLEESDLPYNVDLLLRDERLDPAVDMHISTFGKPFTWKPLALGEAVELKRGYDLPEVDRQPGDIPVVSSSGISGRHSIAKVKAPGVVMGRYGTLGNVVYLARDFWPLNTTLYVRDFKGNDPQFVSYLLRSMDFRGASDKSSVPGLNRNDLHRYGIRLPPLADQRVIAGVLGALDDKIEQNRRTSAALEGLARAMFRAWFVDHEPVKAKAAGATSFSSMPQAAFDALPATFTDSPLGPIPQGWEVGTLGDILSIQNGFAFKSKDWKDIGVPVVKIGSVKPGIVDLENVSYVSHEIAATAQRFQLAAGDILIGMTGYVGEVGLVPQSETAPLLNQRVGKANVGGAAGTCSVPFPYFSMRRPEFKADVVAKAHGTAQANVSASAIESVATVLPPSELMSYFNLLAAPFIDFILGAHAESRHLAQLRDYLLPKLLSGQVRVRDAEVK